MDFNNAYGAGLRHAYIKDSDGVEYDIEAVVSVDADNEQEDTEVRGDDAIKATFSSSRKETLTITANAVSFDVIQAITGNSISSSATGMEVPLGSVSELNPPFVEIGGRTNGRTEDGDNVVIEKVFHRVQINSVRVNAAGESEFSLEMSGQAIQSDEDIEGNALATPRTSTLRVYQGQQP